MIGITDGVSVIEMIIVFWLAQRQLVLIICILFDMLDYIFQSVKSLQKKARIFQSG